ncbi:hypothetical protein V8F20_000942 [Naviculisporaceae sp. PSN 640]
MFKTISQLVYFFTSAFRFTFRFLLSPFGLARRLCYSTHSVVMSAITKRTSGHYVSKKDAVLDKLGVKTQVEATCPICQEPIGYKNAEGITEGWSLLPCGHRFGSYCIKHYLNLVAEDRPSCPVCRQIAYHQCGHPVLPVLLKPNGSKAEIIVESADLLVEEMKNSQCAYCLLKIVNEERLLGFVAETRRGSRWKSLVGWSKILAFTKKRKASRRSRRAPDPVPAPEPAVVVPASQDTSQSGFPTLSRQPQPGGNGAGWNGPWVDPFPKARDHGWERWWRQQEPVGA